MCDYFVLLSEYPLNKNDTCFCVNVGDCHIYSNCNMNYKGKILHWELQFWKPNKISI